MNPNPASTIAPDATRTERAVYIAAWLSPTAHRAHESWRTACAAEETAAELCDVEHYDDDGIVRVPGQGMNAAGYCTGDSPAADLHRLTQIAVRTSRALYDELTEMHTVYDVGTWRTPGWDDARAATREAIESRPMTDRLGSFGRAFVAAAAGEVEAGDDGGDEPPAPRSAPVSAARGPIDGDLDTAARRRELARDAIHPTLYAPGNRG